MKAHFIKWHKAYIAIFFSVVIVLFMFLLNDLKTQSFNAGYQYGIEQSKAQYSSDGYKQGYREGYQAGYDDALEE